MKIYFATPEFVTEEGSFDGGLSNYIYKTAQELIKRNISVTVLVASSKDEELLYENIKVIRVSLRNKFISLLSIITFHKLDYLISWLYQSYRFNKILKKLHLDSSSLVQFSSYTAPAILYRNIKVPYVVRVSGFQPEIMRQYGVSKSSLIYKQIYWLEKLMFQKSKFIFGPSSTIANLLKKEFDVDVEIIRTPFSLSKVKTFELDSQNKFFNKQYFLFFGTIGALKGVGDIAEIIYQLLELYPSMQFVFVGKDTVYKHTSMLEYLYEKSGQYRDRVIYLGKLNVQELYPVIYNSRRVVLPSRFDNLPNTCIEALAMGKIVIGTKNSSIDELIVDGQNGFLCELGNPVSLLSTIQRSMKITSSEELILSQNAQSFTDSLNSDKVVNDLINFYTYVLNSWEVINE